MISDEEKAKIIAEGEELQVFMEKMNALKVELGITDIENATMEQMLALSEGMFGKK